MAARALGRAVCVPRLWRAASLHTRCRHHRFVVYAAAACRRLALRRQHACSSSLTRTLLHARTAARTHAPQLCRIGRSSSRPLCGRRSSTTLASGVRTSRDRVKRHAPHSAQARTCMHACTSAAPTHPRSPFAAACPTTSTRPSATAWRRSSTGACAWHACTCVRLLQRRSQHRLLQRMCRIIAGSRKSAAKA